MSSKGIEPFTALTNSFTENHHYQSDHLPYNNTFFNFAFPSLLPTANRETEVRILQKRKKNMRDS